MADTSGIVADPSPPVDDIDGDGNITTKQHNAVRSVIISLNSEVAGKAATSHTHAASDITSGVFPVARLGTGTPDGTKYLSDAGTFTTPPGGVSDHGALTGLADDDHIQYQLRTEKNSIGGYAGLDGSSKLTGSQQVYGTGSNTACEGNDSRLSDSRTPTAHASTHAAAGSDPLSGLSLSQLNITGTPDGTKFLRDDDSWQAIPGGGDALTTNPLSQFAATTSAQLAGVISDETGSGALVFATSPTLVTPDIGNATGNISGNAATVTTNANLTGDVTSTGNSTAIATGVIVNADINASAAIALSKLATDPLARANHTGTQAITTVTPATAYQRIRTNSGATALEHFTEQAGIPFVIDGGGAVIEVGEKPPIEVPIDCVIKSVRLLADQTGSIVIDIWKDTYANYPPTVADTITASAKPTISSAIKSEDTSLTGWTTTLSKGDILKFKVDSVTSIQYVTLSLIVDKRG